MSTQFKRNYGLLHSAFVSQKPNSNSIIMGAKDQTDGLWTRVLGVRAAHILWYELGIALFPEKFENVSANLRTFMFRSTTAPSITMDLSVERLHAKDEHHADFEVVGRSTAMIWSIQLKNIDAIQLWDSLDALLGTKANPETLTSDTTN